MAAGDLRWPETGPRSGAPRRGRAATKGKAIPRANGAVVSVGAVRRRNEAKILEAAEAIFAKHGFNGASTAAIARKAGVPKANLHYYFRTKQVLYASVLDNILEIWLDAMDEIRPEADPADAFSRYIARKIESSRTLPEPSRLWAMELLGGARHVHPFLEKRLRRMVREKATIIKSWIRAGKMAPVDPPHLLFAIWAMTQTYADFAAQMAPVLGKKRLDDDVFRTATETVTTLVLRGLGLRR